MAQQVKAQLVFDEGQGLSTQEQQYDPTPIMRHQELDRLALKQATGADVQYVLSENRDGGQMEVESF